LEISYILTNKKNSDSIENFSGTIRGHNGSSRNPSVREFNDIMGRLLSMKLLSYSSNLMNCEADEDQYLKHSLNLTYTHPNFSLIQI